MSLYDAVRDLPLEIEEYELELLSLQAQGLEFLIRQSDGLVLADTFRCVPGR